MIKKGLTVCSFAERVKKALTNVQIEANAHAREKFLTDIRKVREIEDPQQANQFLERMRTRLDNPDVLSIDTVHQMLISYRFVSFVFLFKLGNFLGMIKGRY